MCNVASEITIFLPVIHLEYTPTKVFELRKYFRQEVDPVASKLEPYYRIEVGENGELEEVCGLEINDLDFEEVVGMELVELGRKVTFNATIRLEIEGV